MAMSFMVMTMSLMQCEKRGKRKRRAHYDFLLKRDLTAFVHCHSQCQLWGNELKLYIHMVESEQGVYRLQLSTFILFSDRQEAIVIVVLITCILLQAN